MKKLFVWCIALGFALFHTSRAQMFTYASGSVSFFSKTSMENIDARNSAPRALLSIPERKIAFIAETNNFRFRNKLMEEHFNEKYVESEKYPLATFQGKVVENIDLSKDGVYQVNVDGLMSLHGVNKERTIPGTITVKGESINLKSVFKIACRDHNITIPSVVGTNISEEVEVTVDVNLVPKK